MIVKVLGGIDVAAALAFLFLIFGMNVAPQYLFFCAALLFVKGMFLFMGDILSAVDLFSAILLILAIPFSLPSILLWIPAFLLLAKGAVSLF